MIIKQFKCTGMFHLCNAMERGRVWTYLLPCLCIVQLLSGISLNLADACDAGTSDPASHISTAPGATTDGRSFFIGSPASTCCGTLGNWKVYSHINGTVTGMIWRPTTGSDYKLVYMEDYTVLAGLNTPSSSVEVQVLIDDIVGWKTSGAELIPSSATAGSSTQNQLLNPTLNAVVPWSQAPDTTNTYAFGAVITENTAPSILNGSETIAESSTSQVVHTLGITDLDSITFIDDTTVVISGTSPTTTDFSINTAGTDFTIESGSSVTPGVYELEITVTDICLESVSATVTITVENVPPVFDAATLATEYVSLSDSTTSATSLYAFSVTDTDTITCTTDNSLFEIRVAAPNQEIWLTNIATTDLHFDTSDTENITINCTDGTSSITRLYNVRISDEQLVLSGLGTTTGPIGDLTGLATSIHQFTVVDQDDSVSCSVDLPEFAVTTASVTTGTQTFDIETELTFNEDTQASYTLTISCDDGENVLVTGTQTVTISDDPPTLSGADFTSTAIPDGLQAVASPLESFTVTDVNDEGIITCIITPTNDALFAITGTPPNMGVETIAGQTLSFSSSPYLVIITCSDDKAANDVSATATVPVTDDPPSFVGTFPTGSDLLDDTVIETTLDTFTVSDPDAACSITSPVTTVYEIRNVSNPVDANQPEFDIGVSSSVTEANINANDQSGALTLTIECTDGSTTISATYDVTILDQDPVFDANSSLSTPYPALSDATVTAENLTTFTVEDSDDTMTCDIESTYASKSSFEIRAATYPYHEVWVSTSPGLIAGVYTLPITCSDGTTADIVNGTYTVTVFDAPPVFVDMPYTVTPALTDATITDTFLHNYTVTDLSSVSVITCSYSATTPYDDDFDIRGTSPDFDIYVLAANDLNYDIDTSVTVTVTCSDGTIDIVEDITVDLYDEDPTWTGFSTQPSAYQFIADQEESAKSLYTFSVVDSDDVIVCEVDAPESDHFEINEAIPGEFTIMYRGRPPASLDYTIAESHNISVTCNDGALYSASVTYQVDLANNPPVYDNLPNGTPTISESITAKTHLYTVRVNDTTETNCYLTNTSAAAGILPLEKVVPVTLPVTEYNVYAHHTIGFDFESGVGSISIDISCGDSVGTITDTLIVTIENAAPVVINPGESSTISESVDGEETLKTFNFEIFDRGQTTCTMTDTDGGPFGCIDNQIVKSSGALDYETQSVYNLAISCTDGFEITTDTHTVYIENVGPEILNLPLGVELIEEQEDELSLIGLTLSESATDCSQVAPVDPEFVIKFEPTTSMWSISYVSQAVAGKTLSFADSPFHDIDVICTDSTGAQGASKRYTIAIIDNKAPIFTNIGDPVTTSVELIAKDFGATDIVFTVTAEDPTSPQDDITFTLVQSEPSDGCPYNVSSNGDITTSVDLHTYHERICTLSIMVEDKYNMNTSTKDLILKIVGNNTVPVFTNLPRIDKVGIVENAYAIGDTVFTLSADDPDTIPTADTLTYYCDFTDGGGAFFECDSATGAIKTIDDIDYETINQLEYRVEVYVNDGYANSDVESVTLKILDENEQPTFTTPSWTISNPDEGEYGEVIACPDFYNDIDDEDYNEAYIYTMDCPTGDGVFTMDNTGCVTMLKEWDLDDATKRKGIDTVTCTVTATDKNGRADSLSTTTTLNIEINEEDDNIPYLSQTSYKYCATVGSTSGTLGNVVIDDNDVLAAHRIHTYELIGAGPFVADGNGQLTYGDISNYPTGTVFETTLRVTDEAGNSDESPVTVLVCEPTPSSPSSSSSSASSAAAASSSTDNMLFWLIPAILLGVLMLGLTAFLIRRCCISRSCGQWRPCMKTSPTTLRTVQPMEVIQTHPAKPIQPEQPSTVPRNERGKIPGLQDLPMTNYYARDIGNTGAYYPT